MQSRVIRGDMDQTYTILEQYDKIDASKVITQAWYKGITSPSIKLFRAHFESQPRKYCTQPKDHRTLELNIEHIVHSESGHCRTQQFHASHTLIYIFIILF